MSPNTLLRLAAEAAKRSLFGRLIDFNVIRRGRLTPRISCERPVLAEGRARGVPLLRVPWGRSEGDRLLHPVVLRHKLRPNNRRQSVAPATVLRQSRSDDRERDIDTIGLRDPAEFMR